MKKSLVIGLLGILLFNWFGYQFLASWLQIQANARLEASLDDHQYVEAELTLLKAPITHLPYFSHSLQFERMDGQVEINGMVFNFVRFRLYGDSVEVECIPNYALMKWQGLEDRFIRWNNDLEQNRQDKKSDTRANILKTLSLEFYDMNERVELGISFFSLPKRIDHFFMPPSYYIPGVIENPPERI